MAFAPPARHLLRGKDLADARYSEAIEVADMASAAGLSKAHFSREFHRTFGESPHHYLLTRRLERAASLLRMTDWTVGEICVSVGLQSLGSFTSSFKRTFEQTPTEYRASQPPAALAARVPSCVLRTYLRPQAARFKKTRGRPANTLGPQSNSNEGDSDGDDQGGERPALGA
jgi:AraC-like DNA-binding protein